MNQKGDKFPQPHKPLRYSCTKKQIQDETENWTEAGDGNRSQEEFGIDLRLVRQAESQKGALFGLHGFEFCALISHQAYLFLETQPGLRSQRLRRRLVRISRSERPQCVVFSTD